MKNPRQSQKKCSRVLQKLQKAFKAGRSITIKINGVTIVVEPDAPVSGMTLFGEHGFVLGKEAFTSREELVKTILHETYRLKHSTISKTGASQPKITQETKQAYEYAEKMAGEVLKRIKDAKYKHP